MKKIALTLILLGASQNVFASEIYAIGKDGSSIVIGVQPHVMGPVHSNYRALTPHEQLHGTRHHGAHTHSHMGGSPSSSTSPEIEYKAGVVDNNVIRFNPYTNQNSIPGQRIFDPSFLNSQGGSHGGGE